MTHLAFLTLTATHRWLNPHRHISTAMACECAWPLCWCTESVSPIKLTSFKNVTSILFLGWLCDLWGRRGAKGYSSQASWSGIIWQEGGEGCSECGWNVRGQECCLSKQAGICIKGMLFCPSLKEKMEKEKQVLTSWQASLPPSVSLPVSTVQSVSVLLLWHKWNETLGCWDCFNGAKCQHSPHYTLYCIQRRSWWIFVATPAGCY